MIFFKPNRRLCGIELSSAHIRTALVSKGGSGWRLEGCAETPLDKDILSPSFRTENIINSEKFRKKLLESLNGCGINKGRIAAALPNETVKILITSFADLPKESHGISEMLKWYLTKSLNISTDDIRISWEDMGHDKDNRHVLLLGLVSEQVLSQYEAEIKAVGVVPQIVSSTAISRFDFCAESVPEKGRVAYLGFFEDSMTIFVFSDGVPFFYKTIIRRKGGIRRTGGGRADAIENDREMLVQYYKSENPDSDISKMVIACPSYFRDVIEAGFFEDKSMEIEIVDTLGVMTIHQGLDSSMGKDGLSIFSAAAGAAQGLAETRHQDTRRGVSP